ncbi:MAG: C40 family peptidase [Gemmatimonadota bacterium]
MPAAIVTAAVAPVLARPGVRSEQVSQAVMGETAAVLEEEGAWRRLRLGRDGYEGWVHAGYLREVPSAEAWEQAADGWSLGATVALAGGGFRQLPLGARVETDRAGIVLPNGMRAWLTSGEVASRAEVVAKSRRVPAPDWALEHFAGAPYEWGGVTPWGVDCSGLVQMTFAARGVCLPRDAWQQAGAGEPVQPAEARPGDLLFFAESGDRITHVAFLAEDDTLIHSTLACGGVLREPWGPGTRAAFLRERLVAVRRIDDGR